VVGESRLADGRDDSRERQTLMSAVGYRITSAQLFMLKPERVIRRIARRRSSPLRVGCAVGLDSKRLDGRVVQFGHLDSVSVDLYCLSHLGQPPE